MTDEEQIRRLNEQLMDGWNQGRAEAFAAPFTEEVDFVAFDGTYFKGRRELMSAHQPLFDKWLKDSRLTGEIKSVRFLTSEVAVMHVIGQTIMGGKSKPSPERESLQTFVVVKKGSEWRITAFHNNRIRPIGGSAGGPFFLVLTDWLWKVLRPKK